MCVDAAGGDDQADPEPVEEVNGSRQRDWQTSIDTQDAGHMWHGRQVPCSTTPECPPRIQNLGLQSPSFPHFWV